MNPAEIGLVSVSRAGVKLSREGVSVSRPGTALSRAVAGGTELGRISRTGRTSTDGGAGVVNGRELGGDGRLVTPSAPTAVRAGGFGSQRAGPRVDSFVEDLLAEVLFAEAFTSALSKEPLFEAVFFERASFGEALFEPCTASGGRGVRAAGPFASGRGVWEASRAPAPSAPVSAIGVVRAAVWAEGTGGVKDRGAASLPAGAGVDAAVWI
jgi:hypothetical protein